MPQRSALVLWSVPALTILDFCTWNTERCANQTVYIWSRQYVCFQSRAVCPLARVLRRKWAGQSFQSCGRRGMLFGACPLCLFSCTPTVSSLYVHSTYLFFNSNIFLFCRVHIDSIHNLHEASVSLSIYLLLKATIGRKRSWVSAGAVDFWCLYTLGLVFLYSIYADGLIFFVLVFSWCCSIPTTLPATLTVGGHQPLNNFGDLLREEISRAGYTEMLTHGLCSREENFKVPCRKSGVKQQHSSSAFQTHALSISIGGLLFPPVFSDSGGTWGKVVPAWGHNKATVVCVRF